MDTIAYDSPVHRGRLEDASQHHASRASNRSVVLQRVLLGADLVSATIGGAVPALIFGVAFGPGLAMTTAVVVNWILIAFVCGLYNANDLHTWASGLSDAPRTVLAALLMAWPVFAVSDAVAPEHALSYAVLATFSTVMLDSILRALGRGFVHRIAPLRQRTVVVGSGFVADRLADRLDRHREFGLEAIGLVDDDVHTLNGTQRLPKLGSLDQLDTVLEECAVDRVIIAFSRASHQQLLSSIRTCRDHHVAVDVVPRLFELLDGAQAMSLIGGLPVLAIGAPPLTPASRIAKRLLDVVGSLTLLILLSPLLLAIAIAIKIDSRGRVLFRQERAGRGQKTFMMIKFRSMYKDADRRKEQFEKENEATDGVMFKIKRDPRVTRVGRFLRPTSIDELPQLLNVLRGDMSLVGPRPLILSESKHAAQNWHARRLDLRPGITGLWQVSGRSDIPFQEMVRFDYQYVSGWSLARDVEILLATIPVVLSRRGAY
jgi:exopolysaccharide biosynthesis polyprenyl glycosylphosphotransferase